MLTIHPYLKIIPDKKSGGQQLLWVFDDEQLKLKSEAFVCGMSEMITAMLLEKGIENAQDGFELTFSDVPFENDSHDCELEWAEAETFEWKQEKGINFVLPGNWYVGCVGGNVMEGWLCPALLLYFDKPPATIYVKAEELPEGVNPIWTVPVTLQKMTKEFVSQFSTIPLLPSA